MALPLFRRILLLLGVALLPAFVLLLSLERDARDAREALLRMETMRLVALLRADQESIVDAARQLVTGLRSTLPLQEQDSGRCNGILQQQLPQLTRYASLLVADAEGRVVCSGRPEAMPASIAGQPEFRAALATADFIVGEYQEEAGRPAVLPFAQRLHDADGGLAGVVVAALDLQWLNHRLAGLLHPAQATAAIADRAGTILAHSAGRDRAGSRLDPALLPLLQASGPGATALDQAGGSRLLLGHALTAAPAGLLVTIGLDAQGALDAAHRRGQLLLAAGVLLSLGLAWWVAHRCITGPVQGLLAIAERWRAGNLVPRIAADAGLAAAAGRGEFARLAQAFDAVAAAAEQREQALHGVLESTTDWVLSVDAGWRLRYANGQARARLPEADPAAAPLLWHAFPGLRGGALWPACESAMAHRLPVSAEGPDPAEGLMLQLSAYPAPDGGLTLFLRDVTARHRAERALVQSEAASRLALTAADLGAWTTRADSDQVEFDTRCAVMLGLAPDQRCLTTTAFYALVHAADAAALQATIATALSARQAFRASFRLLRADDGAERWLEASATVTLGKTDQHVWHGVLADITDRKAKEAELAGNAAMLQVALSTARLVAWTMPLEGDHLFFNGACPLGWGDSVSRQEMLSTLHEEDRASFVAALERTARHGQPERVLVRQTDPDDGALYWREISARMVPMPDGKLVWHGVVGDVTDRQRETLHRIEQDNFVRLALHGARLSIWSLDAETRLISGAGALALCGWPPGTEQLACADFMAQVLPADTPRLEAAIQQALAAGESFTLRFRLRLPDGPELRWMEASASMALLPDGRRALLGVIGDVTENHEQLQAQLEQDSLLRVALGAAGQAVWTAEPATGRLFLDTRGIAMIGWPEGTPWIELNQLGAAMPAPDYGALQDAMRQAQAQDRPYSVSFRLARRIDGAQRWFRQDARPLQLPDGREVIIGVLRDVTEERAAQRAAEEHATRLSMAMEAAGLGAWTLDTATQEFIADPRAADLTGWQPGTQRIGRVAYGDNIHPDDRPAVCAETQDAIDNHRPYRVAYRYRRPADGVERWLESYAVPGDASGRLWHGLTWDITDQRRAHQAIAEREMRLKLALEAAGMGSWRNDMTTGTMYPDERAVAISGLPPEAVHGIDPEAVYATVHPDDREELIATHMQALRECRAFRTTFRNRRQDGTEQWLEIFAGPSDAEGHFWHGVSWDITERRKAHEAIAEREMRLKLALEAAGMGAWSYDSANGLVYPDDNAAAIYGMPAGIRAIEVAATFEGVHPDDLPHLLAQQEEALRLHRPLRAVFRHRRRNDDVEHWIEICASPRGPDSTMWHGLSWDVTERRQAEERQLLLMREVDHRARNALAVVMATVRMTRAPDTTSFIRTVEGRIAAMGRAQALLTQSKWTGADLRSLLEGEFTGFLGTAEGVPQARLEGPAVQLDPTAAQGLSMTLHELATNAIKHGGLSCAGGSVTVTWWQEDKQRLRLRWQESGGPLVAGPPARKGFGSRVIDSTVQGQLHGRVVRSWEAAGLVAELDIPLRTEPMKMIQPDAVVA